MSTAQVCLVLSLVTMALVAPLHAQIFGIPGLGGAAGGGNRNRLRLFCILGKRLESRMNCDTTTSAMCTYIKSNISRCPGDMPGVIALGNTLKRMNQGRGRTGRIPIPIPRMLTKH